MYYLEFYRKKGISEGTVFDEFMEHIKSSIKIWEYFVNWDKVFTNSNKFKIELNLLNSLIGTDDLKKDFIDLIIRYPNIIRVLPVILAVRDTELEIIRDYKSQDLSYLSFDFRDILTLNEEKAEDYFLFLKNSGLIKLFHNRKIKNFADYVYGVEVGLDSNGRKNRGGIIMEEIVEVFIKNTVLQNKDLDYIPQASAIKIRQKWNCPIGIDRTARSFDFAVYNRKTNKLFVIETNFYNSGGSKLKATCGEYKSVFDFLNSQNIEFAWITDGYGWLSTRRPLEETFSHNKYVFNLWLVQEGILVDLFSR